MTPSSETIKTHAERHAFDVLGADQFKKNKDAVESISGDFQAGAEWCAAQLPTATTDAQLLEVQKALKDWPKTFVAKGLEIGTVHNFRIAKMNGNKNDDQFAKAIAKVWNAAPGLILRALAATPAPATPLADAELAKVQVDANTFYSTLANYATADGVGPEFKAFMCNALPGLLARLAAADFQGRVAKWMAETFEPSVLVDYQERGHRFAEEAIELLQANGTSKDDILRLVDYVYSRPAGELSQEVGGTMVTLAALCGAHGVSLSAAADTEQTRVEQPEVRARIQTKQADKRARMMGTPLPGAAPTANAGKEPGTC